MKKYLATILSVLMLLATPITAYASEVGISQSFKCNVTFYITDETADGYPGSSFTVNMKDETGTLNDSYKFTSGNSWKNSTYNPIYTMTAPATYTVTVDGMEDGYMLIDTVTRSETLTFETFSDGTANVLWSIVEAETEMRETNTDNSSILEQDGNFSATNEGAEEVYKNFLEATAFLSDGDDEDWNWSVLQIYELSKTKYAEWYVDYVSGGTEEEFLSMSLYDRFVWAETYLEFAYGIDCGDFDFNYGNKENFQNHVTRILTDKIDSINKAKGNEDGNAVKEAYLALADWQYAYVKENGVPFNFINNRSYLEEVGEAPTQSETKDEEEEIAEALEELLEDVDEEDLEGLEEEKETGVWDDVMDSLSRNIITIIVILILLAALAFVIRKRKKMNIDDSVDDTTSIDHTKDD